MTDKKLRSTG